MKPVRDAVEGCVVPGKWHTIPVDPSIWDAYSGFLFESLVAHSDTVLGFDAVGDEYRDLSEYVRKVCDSYTRVCEHVLSLQPFEPFDCSMAGEILNCASAWSQHAVELILQQPAAAPSRDAIHEHRERWTVAVDHPDRLGCAFDVDVPLTDENGVFAPGLVLAAYAYRTTDLLQVLAPHMRSLNLPVGPELLANVSIVGWIVSAEDPVVAYLAAYAYLNAMLLGDIDVVAAEQRHFTGREQRTRQASRRSAASLMSARADKDGETRALRLAGVFKATVEGTVRQYGWALRCMEAGQWSPSPMLGTLRDALIKHGGFSGRVAEACLMVDFRNGEAHEDLAWNGFRNVYMAGDTVVNPSDVRDAIVIGSSFGLGCDAARAAYASLHHQPTWDAPDVGDKHRLPNWQRAAAQFGTNNIVVLNADFNSTTARVFVETITTGHINPCFQALISVHRLLPDVEEFEVYIGDDTVPVIAVSARALAATYPVWNDALTTFAPMPLGAFLPINYDARRHHESELEAVKAVAWIAADDLLGAIDGDQPFLTSESLDLLRDRVTLVVAVLDACLPLMGQDTTARPRAIATYARELRRHLSGATQPVLAGQLDGLDAVQNIRRAWELWGPAPRLPTIPEGPETAADVDDRPRRRPRPDDLSWQTI